MLRLGHECISDSAPLGNRINSLRETFGEKKKEEYYQWVACISNDRKKLLSSLEDKNEVSDRSARSASNQVPYTGSSIGSLLKATLSECSNRRSHRREPIKI